MPDRLVAIAEDVNPEAPSEEEGEVRPDEESPRRPRGMRIGGTRGGIELGSTWVGRVYMEPQ